MPTAAEYKAEGTAHFTAKRYLQAVKCYTDAINAESDAVELAKLLGNRSTSFGLLGEHSSALEDAKQALQHDSNYLKGYFRQATALMALGRFADAAAAAAEGLQKQPGNAQLQQLLQEARSKSNAASRSSNADMGDGDDEDDEDDDEEMDEDDEESEEEEEEEMEVAPPTPVNPEQQAEQRKEAGNVEYKRGEYARAVQLYSQARLPPSPPPPTPPAPALPPAPRPPHGPSLPAAPPPPLPPSPTVGCRRSSWRLPTPPTSSTAPRLS